MNNVPLSDFYTTTYIVQCTNYLNQRWSRGKVWQCITKPKADNLLLYFKNGGAVYTFNGTQTLTVKAGDVCYTHVGCRYSVCFEGADTIETSAIRFKLFDERGEEVAFADKPTVFDSKIRNAKLFDSAQKLSEKTIQIPAKYHALLYEFISDAGHEIARRKFTNFPLIEKGVAYLNAHIEENVSVEDVARMCNISAVYFRRMFKEVMGVSPSEYRIQKRVEKAKMLLEYSEDSIEAIGQALGYTDTSYFIKQFKAEVGLTPYAYKKRL